jgi:hypothetical protein
VHGKDIWPLGEDGNGLVLSDDGVASARTAMAQQLMH